MCCLFALCCSWIDSTRVPALCLPLPIVYPRVLTGAKQRGECGDSRHWAYGPTTARATQAPPCRAAIRGVPAADSAPLRGRQAESFKYQSTRSEPRRNLLFTGHRSSSLGSVSENPPPRRARGDVKQALSGFSGRFWASKSGPRVRAA